MIFFNDPVPVPDPAEGVAMRARVHDLASGLGGAWQRVRRRREGSPRVTRWSEPSTSPIPTFNLLRPR